MAMSERERRNLVLSLLPDEKVQPQCEHVTEGCGGCLMQDTTYEAQVQAKEQMLEKIYGTHVRVVPCPDPLGYRNRMDFVAAFGKKGLRKRGKFDWVVDIKDCWLLPEHARGAWKIVRDAVAGVEDYHYIKHRGFLRYLVIRTSRSTKETMLIVTTASPSTRDDHEAFQTLLERLKERANLTSVHWRVNDSMTDVSIGQPFWHTGKEWIVDEIAERQFRIYPETFFQANTLMAGGLFMEALGYAKGAVLDLYSGVGVLSILAAQKEEVQNVVGVDIIPGSVEAAKENAILNGVPVEKCKFVCEDAAIYLRDYPGTFDTVICDPSRPGLGDACELLLGLLPEWIIYISCNPVSHRDDLEKFAEAYDVVRLDAYDLFPQTPHVEVLSVLRRKSGGQA